ncbi:zinc finger protein 616-like [Maniola jurtina]|uniref:zinc finger protein 616-like n=1 Tax=Maniola jurtina TaxID=191418 RepID=UPI001E6866F5|nr:zinc finger protein 616-like [Maniola jurtina]
MEDHHEISLKDICCTCLSTERNLSKLCRVENGVNDLFSLLSYKSDAYEAMFVKDMTQLFICWECIALLQRFSKFREQVCIAHSKLTDIIDGKVDCSNIKTLSKLTICNQIGYDHVSSIKVEDPEAFVDCGPENVDIKFESDTDDEPLAELSYLKTEGDGDNIEEISIHSPDTKYGVKKNKRKAKNKDIPFVEIPIDNYEVDDNYNISEEDLNDFDDSEIGKPLSCRRKMIKTYVPPLPIAKYGNSYLYGSKSMLENKKIDFIIRNSKKLVVKLERPEVINGNSTIDFENILDTPRGKRVIELKGNERKKNKNVRSDVNIPISNGDNKNMFRNDEKHKDSVSNKAKLKVTKGKIRINLIKMNRAERLKNIEARKLKDEYVNAMNKCEECVEVFEDCDTLEKHITELHGWKPNTNMCNVCKVHVKMESLNIHKKEHYLVWKCVCKESLPYKFNCMENVRNHLKSKHFMKDANIDAQMKILTEQEDRIVKNKIYTEPEKQLTVLVDDPKGPGFACWQCKQYFRSQKLRNEHVQKCHTEGFQCFSCGKKYSLKGSLKKHEMIHCNPPPRQQCPICGKMVCAYRVKAHALIHSEKQYPCKLCDKKFSSLYSYQLHLKYTRQHADTQALKYKCSLCGKYYRSPGELRDHHNYRHEAKSIHKCPICHTVLASARGIYRHIKRVHEDKQEKRNKICQTCGKAFLVQKTLREHERIHTGEKPIPCDLCARTFRQRAALYTHKRRVHKVPLKKKIIYHTDDIKDVMNPEINKSKD